MSEPATLAPLPPTDTPAEPDWIDQLLLLCERRPEAPREDPPPDENALAKAYAASLGMEPTPRCPEASGEDPALRRPEASPPRGSPLRKWGPYYVPRPDGSRRHCPDFLQVKLLKFLLAFEQDCSVKDGLAAANVTRRQYNRWLLAIPNFAADVQDLREDLADDHEKELNARIRKGDAIALRTQLRAERPEKYDPRWRRALPPPGPPPGRSFPLNKRIDLTAAPRQKETPLGSTPLSPLPLSPEPTQPKVPSWKLHRTPAPVLR